MATVKTDEDKYEAVWLSYSSISDFLICPRLYYYANMYKNPKSGRKITIMKAPLALGQAVHSVIEALSDLPADKRFEISLLDRLNKAWPSISGKMGGFSSAAQEKEYKDRAIAMLNRITDHPGPLARKAVKLKNAKPIPNYWLSEEENLILCGKVDWLEYLEDEDAVHVIDFKTGKQREKGDSLQLPIYLLLTQNTQNREVAKMSYWYISQDNEPHAVDMPDAEAAHEAVMKVGMRIKLARQLKHFKCGIDEKEGCSACNPYEAIVKGRGEFVGVGELDKEVYILPDKAVSL